MLLLICLQDSFIIPLGIIDVEVMIACIAVESAHSAWIGCLRNVAEWAGRSLIDRRFRCHDLLLRSLQCDHRSGLVTVLVIVLSEYQLTLNGLVIDEGVPVLVLLLLHYRKIADQLVYQR